MNILVKTTAVVKIMVLFFKIMGACVTLKFPRILILEAATYLQAHIKL